MPLSRQTLTILETDVSWFIQWQAISAILSSNIVTDSLYSRSVTNVLTGKNWGSFSCVFALRIDEPNEPDPLEPERVILTKYEARVASEHVKLVEDLFTPVFDIILHEINNCHQAIPCPRLVNPFRLRSCLLSNCLLDCPFAKTLETIAQPSDKLRPFRCELHSVPSQADLI